MALRDLIHNVDNILPTLHESVRTEVLSCCLLGLFLISKLNFLLEFILVFNLFLLQQRRKLFSTQERYVWLGFMTCILAQFDKDLIGIDQIGGSHVEFHKKKMSMELTTCIHKMPSLKKIKKTFRTVLHLYNPARQLKHFLNPWVLFHVSIR